MEDRHTAITRIRDSKAVYVYDVHPKPDKFLHEHGYIKGDALLVQAYVDKATGKNSLAKNYHTVIHFTVISLLKILLRTFDFKCY